jgi:hypothetical protein
MKGRFGRSSMRLAILAAVLAAAMPAAAADDEPTYTLTAQFEDV